MNHTHTLGLRSLVSIHGRLYAIGGFPAVDSVEVYDPKNNIWTLFLQHKLDGGVTGAALIKKYFVE